ncbi:interferon-induced protein with tetratricopeptide repeats 5-like isoform X2 [Ptychodera flava]|uniref:interferon-induced protein with tetratricopeptide repeats 5-like isoform X2 n=1 Tax=Ptychodera flava TaxID=63121 RepID=UPI00396A8A68
MNTSDYRQQLEKFPSQFIWELEDETERNFEEQLTKIKRHLDETPTILPVPFKTLRGYMHVSKIVPRGSKDHECALKWFDEALKDHEEEVAKSGDSDGPLGDKVIILANKAWVFLELGNTEEVDRLLKNLHGICGDGLTKKQIAYKEAHKAVSLMRFGPVKYGDSMACYERSLKEYPENVDWLFGLALVTGRKDRYDFFGSKKTRSASLDREEVSLRKVIELDPNYSLARVFLAEKIVDNQTDEAQHHIEEALRRSPNTTVVLQRSGQFFRKLKHLDRALELFKRALELEPTSSFIHHQVGLAYRDKYFKAKHTGYRQKFVPAKRTNHRRHGYHRDEPQYFMHKAFESYDKAIQLSGGYQFAAQNDKAYAYILSGEMDAAEGIYSKLTDTAIGSDKTKAFYNLARFHHKTKKNVQEALKFYKKTVESRANQHFVEKAAHAIIDQMRARLRRDENDVDALRELGWVYFKRERFSEACQYYEEAFETSNDNSLAQILVEISLKLRNIEKAGRYLEILREFDEDSYNIFKPIFSVIKGEEYLKASKLTDAKEAFAEAISYGSLVGCQQMLEILKSASDDEKCKEAWLKQCVEVFSLLDGPESKILRPDENTESGGDGPSIGGLRSVLEEILPPYDILRELYLKYVTSLAHKETGDTLLSTSAEVISTVRNVLDSVMSEFQAQNYDLDPEEFKCKFFYVEDEESVSERVKEKLEEEYQWNEFSSRFPSLFAFLVDIQPGHHVSNRWIVNLYEVSDQLEKMALPERVVVISGDDAVDIIDLSRDSVVKAAKIVREFKKCHHLNSSHDM